MTLLSPWFGTARLIAELRSACSQAESSRDDHPSQSPMAAIEAKYCEVAGLLTIGPASRPQRATRQA